MADATLVKRMQVYQATALFSVLFALLGFSYNVWRLEVTEHNSNVRTASFELILQLAELEQLVYAGHYDQDPVAGSPRVGWVKVGLIADLSIACGDSVQASSEQLKQTWSSNWDSIMTERSAVDAVVSAIDTTRGAVQQQLQSLD